MLIPIIVLLAVFVLIAIRQVGSLRLQIWQVMLLGALAVLFSGQISVLNALKAINWDVILFLFGMFVIGQALEDSGYLAHISYNLFKKVNSANALILCLLFSAGLASAFLMNDTLAIIGTPVVLLLAKKHNFSPKVLLLALAFAVTIGSVMSPIGNPQNLLIAINAGIKNPFVTFFKSLFIPTLINLFAAFFLLKIFYKNHFMAGQLIHSQEPIRDHRLAFLSKISLLLIMVLVLVKIVFVSLDLKIDFRLTYIALISMLPIILFSPKRSIIIKRVDWHTLIFFAAMFVLMQSVWDTGFFQQIITSLSLNITSTPTILAVSIILSQLISNVPLVALYLPLAVHAGASTIEALALAVGSTIAGNLFILGAASNVIIVQNAEKKGGETLTFLEFAKIGVPLTIINSLVYWLFLAIA
ncbi:anion transporter [Candidatus Woesearchaeota archaeon]|nr:anion transporter [Candidatus Woesearchaeota archaeon]